MSIEMATLIGAVLCLAAMVYGVMEIIEATTIIRNLKGKLYERKGND